MANKVIWFDGSNIFVIRKGKTSNEKISEGRDKIVQTYTFSYDQWVYANNVANKSMKDFFKLDGSNCLDCPFSGSTGNAGCYTHKFNQYVGFISMLKSISKDELTMYNQTKHDDVVALSKDVFIRFGTYGEPSLIPLQLISDMANVAKNWTGYTHQSGKVWADGYKDFFMASLETATEQSDWRAFRVLEDVSIDANSIQCPASKEAGYKSTCAKCGLCSGLLGKGSKDVKITTH
jgi:hypothetical protein